MLFAILQKYDFSSKSQRIWMRYVTSSSCLRYCKSTIFQANHNRNEPLSYWSIVVCDTAKVRFFKQITTDKSKALRGRLLFAILQKYDFSSKSQLRNIILFAFWSCLRYCKSTIFQANHNLCACAIASVVCDTAKVRFFKQITTPSADEFKKYLLFAILQKYDFSSKSQLTLINFTDILCCLRYCKSTIFQANHNVISATFSAEPLFAILQKYDFSSKSQQER